MQKLLIIEANFYEHISKHLLDGATRKAKDLGYDYDVLTVAGALEIPAVISMACETTKYCGYVALGCVIRGETSHYDIVANESARGLNQLAIEKKIAIGNGILTVENEEQALVRADPAKKDKGGFAVNACAQMIKIKNNF
jgi:6,7-dimethyl-8-ribityllumazine synthase